MDFSIENVGFFGVMAFSKDGEEIKVDLEEMTIEYDEITLNIQNFFIEALWKVLLNHDFVKNYIIKNTLEDLSKRASELRLNKLFVFELHDKKYVFGMKDKPILRQAEEFFVINNFYLSEQNNETSARLEDPLLSNLQLNVNTQTLGLLLKLFEDKLVIDLNSIPAIKDKLTVRNLSTLFPGMQKLYPNDPDKPILMKIYFRMNEAPIRQTDFNLFLFANVLLEMKVDGGREKLCSMQLDSYINMMINSSSKNLSKTYFNQPNLRVFDVQLEEC